MWSYSILIIYTEIVSPMLARSRKGEGRLFDHNTTGSQETAGRYDRKVDSRTRGRFEEHRHSLEELCDALKLS